MTPTNTMGSLDIYSTFGGFYGKYGLVYDVERMYALAGYEKALGADHTSDLKTVHSLGVQYRNQGLFVDAEKMYDRALVGNWCQTLFYP